ncbi:MAG: AMP-binding protein, partial [Clostridia bacterium]|nr:AMP-binding protein [Clostridia bacterium]
MNLSFSTNGWKLSFEQLLKELSENKIFGLELHDAVSAFGEERPFSANNLAKTKKKLFEYGVRVSCIDAVANLAEDACEKCVKEINSLISLAKDVGCKFVRLHAYSDDEFATADGAVKKVVETVLPTAEKSGVILLVETMGIYADTKRLADTLGEFACDNLSALWDVHHTYVFGGEKPEETIKNLGKHVKHLHIKDSVKTTGGIKYRLLGEGDLPLKEVFSTIRSVNYEGFISLELYPDDLEELGDSEIVLPQFSSFMSGFETVPSWRSGLYDNKTKTGKYIWEKETLIDCTFPQVLDRVVKEFPDQIAFKYTTLDYTRTYSEFRDEVDVVARALMSVGVTAGDHVAVWATNVPEWYLTFWATIKIGAVLVTVNTAYKIHETEYLLKQSDTHTLVLIKGYRDSDYAGIINELCPELKTLTKGKPLRSKRLPFLRNVITVGFEQAGCLTFSEFIERAKT